MNVAEASACLGKFPHNSKADADKQARHKKFLQSYRCPFCGFWHVGHMVAASVKEKWRKMDKKVKKVRHG